MLQTATLVVFAGTFAIAINDFKDLTGGCWKLCSNGDKLGIAKLITGVITFESTSLPPTSAAALELSLRVNHQVETWLKNDLALNSCNRVSSVTLFLSIKNIHCVLQIITLAGACRQVNPDSSKYSELWCDVRAVKNSQFLPCTL